MSLILYLLVSRQVHIYISDDWTDCYWFCRSLGVPCLQYIDDRWIAELMGKPDEIQCVRQENAFKSLYVVCEVLIRLGYFINIEKSKFVPSTVIRFLGMLIDSDRLAFLIPEDKVD